MHSVYLIAPELATEARRPARGDGDVEWVTMRPPLDNFNTLVEFLNKLVLARGLVNVLRIKAHGNSGVVSIFGKTSSIKLDFSKPDVLDAVRKLQGIFDRRPGARREIFLHACYAASDEWIECQRVAGVNGRVSCGILGHTNPPEKRGIEASGFHLLKSMADLANVPVIGTVDLLPYYEPYDWKFPGRVLYVYPGGGVVTFPGIRLEGEFSGWLPDGSADKVNAFGETKLEAPFVVSSKITHPLIDRLAGPKWLAWCSGPMTIAGRLKDWHLKANLNVSGEGGFFTIDCVGAGKGDTICKLPIPFEFKVVRGTGIFLGGEGAGLGRLDVKRNGRDFSLEFIVKRDA
jgi:hypothetical protein